MNAPSFEAPASEWLVYADWLQQQGKPLGEFIVLLNEGDDAKCDTWLRKHTADLVGQAGKQHLGNALSVKWKWGFAQKATVHAKSVQVLNEALEALFAAPAAEKLETVRVEVEVTGDDQVLDISETVALVVAKAPPSVTALELIDDRAEGVTSLTSRDFDPAPNLVDFGPLDALWPRFRSVQLVVADVRQLVFGEINAPQLESLTVHGLRLAGQSYGDAAEPCDAVASLAKARLPKLKHFEMRLNEEWTVNSVDDTDSYTSFDSYPEDEFDSGYSEGADWPAEFGPALRTLVKSPLESLALTNFAETSSFFEMLGSVTLPTSLRRLSLSQSSLSSTDVQWFKDNQKLLAKLDTLVVQETGFNEDDVKTLRTLVKNVEFSRGKLSPRPEYEEEEGAEAEPEVPLPKYRYIVGME
ncbi:MAG: hypothetical protein JNM17_18075 [Archangium sp.]|nr:hypothetical protein [Archangium sp.]